MEITYSDWLSIIANNIYFYILMCWIINCLIIISVKDYEKISLKIKLRNKKILNDEKYILDNDMYGGYYTVKYYKCEYRLLKISHMFGDMTIFIFPYPIKFLKLDWVMKDELIYEPYTKQKPLLTDAEIKEYYERNCKQ